MTPRNQWRRSWVRETLIPVLWLLVVGVLIAGALGFSVSRAAPSPGQVVADEHAADVCMLLDAHPTIGGVIDVMDVLQSDGLSRSEATVALVESVIFTCPIHADLLERLMARSQPQPAPGRGVIQ